MKELIEKLTPRLLFSFLIIALILLAAVSTYTVNQGGDVNIGAWYFNLSSSKEKDTKISQLEKQVLMLSKNPIEEKLLSCQTKLEDRIPIDVITTSLDEEIDIIKIPNRVRTLKECETRYIEHSKNFYFKLFLLEREIRIHGDFITTRMDSPNRKDTYTLIQYILHELNYHHGQISGTQSSTYSAVISFQKAYNEKNPKNKLLPLGYVGYRTLEAMRSWYRTRRDTTIRAFFRNGLGDKIGKS